MVLVVGAGPVGLTMALALRRQGVALRVVDKAAARTDKSKALVVWPRTLELLDVLRCAGDFVAAGMKGRGARMRASGKELLHVTFDRARSDYTYALLIPQSETERLLEAALAATGVQVERETELVSFTQDDGGVAAVLRRADGSRQDVQAAYLAGCDGAHSVVRHGIGAQFDGTTMPSDWVLADLRIDGPLPQDELTISWTEGGVLAVFPIIGGRFRVVADVGTAPEGAPPPTLADIQALLDDRGPPGLVGHDPYWLSHFRINERKVRDYRSGRVFLAGDAAHIHSPAGGQGMNTGMQDAINLAWKLSLVVAGHAKPALLDSYSPERSAIGEQVLRNAGRLTGIGITRNPVLQELRNLAAETLGHLGVVQQRIVDQLTEVDLHYPHSPLTFAPHGAASHPKCGDRARDVALATSEDGAKRLHDALATGRFVVLSVGAPAVAIPASLRRLAVAATAASDAHYDAGHVYLVRPDAYVAASTSGSDAQPLLGRLAMLAM